MLEVTSLWYKEIRVGYKQIMFFNIKYKIIHKIQNK